MCVLLNSSLLPQVGTEVVTWCFCLFMTINIDKLHHRVITHEWSRVEGYSFAHEIINNLDVFI